MISSPAKDERDRVALARLESARSVAPDGGRIEEFDALRGIAILFVMWLHAYFDPWADVSRNELFALHLTQLLANSAVPLFLFMSGVLAARDRHSEFTGLVRARGRRLAIPLLFWVVAALLFETLRTGGFMPELLRAFALFDISGQFYYVFVLLVLSLGLYPLRYVDDRLIKWAVLAAFAVNLATIAFYNTHPLTGFWWTIAYRNPLVWVFAFTFGIYVGRRRGYVAFSNRTVALAGAGMLLAAAVYFAMGEVWGAYPNSYFGVTVFLFAVFGLIVYPAGVRALARTQTGRVLLAPFWALAPYAFGLYLVHTPYFVGVLSGSVVGNAFEHDYLARVWSLFVVGGAASIAFVVLVDRLFPRFSALMLGIEPARTPSTPPGSAVSRRREPEGAGRALRSAHWHSQSDHG